MQSTDSNQRMDNKAAERNRLYRQRHREKINQRRRDIRQSHQSSHQTYTKCNVQNTDEIDQITQETSNNLLSPNSHTQRQQRYYERHKHEINKRRRDKRLKNNISRINPATAAERSRNYRERNKQEINERRRHSRLHQQNIKATRPIQMLVTCLTAQPPSATSTPAPLVSSPAKTPPSVNIRGVGANLLRNDHLECADDSIELAANKEKGLRSSDSSQTDNSEQHQLPATVAAQMVFDQHNLAIVQALQHQLLRGLSGEINNGAMSPATAAAAMMQFSPLLRTYQLALAQMSALAARAGSGKFGTESSTSTAMAETQRLAEM